MKTSLRRPLSLAAAGLAAAASFSAFSHPDAGAAEPEPAAIALEWQRTALTTVPFSPAKSLFLSFASKAVDRVVRQSLRAASSSETAAVAQAAHDVLVNYFPGAAEALDAKLTASLAGVPAGRARARGIVIGSAAADDIIAARADDGRGDPSIVYAAEPGIGVWTDTRPMAAPWYGFVDRVLGGRPVALDGPDPVGSAAYRADLAEVAADGRDGADETKAATARFFNVDAFVLYRLALIRHLETHPLSLRATTDLFADLDLATAEAMRQAWRIKFTLGFWRPVAGLTTDDGDPLTEIVPGWTSVLPLPPYPDYPSGHGTLTGAFAETVRCHLGDLALTLDGAGGSRTFGGLAQMEQEALNSRIWGGIHFRDAMDDAYQIGHTVARRACG